MDKEEILELVKMYKTPFYFYDGEVIVNQIRKLKKAIFKSSRIFYSMKANPLIGICQLMKQEGCGIEVASGGELKTAIKAGIAPNDIIFTSPGKTYEEIAYGIDVGIKLFNVDSLEEIEIINSIAEKKSKKVNIALRINPKENFARAKLKMSGADTQFGFLEENISESVFGSINRLSSVVLVGFQVYSGTQILKSEELIQNTEYVIDMIFSICRKYSIDVKYINLGGGFGVPYFNGEKELNLEELKTGIRRVEEKYAKELENIEVIFESGRFLLADSGIYVTKVLYRKEGRKSLFYICDGGSNFFSSLAFLGRYVRNNFPCYSIPDKTDKRSVNIVGPLCTPTDLLGQKVELSGSLNSGDVIIFEKAGAYGYTFSPTMFLSHDAPSEVLRLNGKLIRLRVSGDSNDFWLNQKGIENESI